MPLQDWTTVVRPEVDIGCRGTSCFTKDDIMVLEVNTTMSMIRSICAELKHLWFLPDISLNLKDRLLLRSALSSILSLRIVWFVLKVSIAWKYLILAICLPSLGLDGATGEQWSLRDPSGYFEPWHRPSTSAFGSLPLATALFMNMMYIFASVIN